MTDIRELIRRLQLGEPNRRIARDPSLSRNTVAGYRQWATPQKLLLGAGRAEWPELFAEPLLPSAALDRLTHGAHFVEITGPSFRAECRWTWESAGI